MNPRKYFGWAYLLFFNLFYKDTYVDLHWHGATCDERVKGLEEGIYEARCNNCKALGVSDHDTVRSLRSFVRRNKLSEIDPVYNSIIVPKGTSLKFKLDRYSGVENIEFTLDTDFEVVAGVELSSKFYEPGTKPVSTHVLGYFIDWRSDAFLDELEDRFYSPRRERMWKMLQKLKQVDERFREYVLGRELNSRADIAKIISEIIQGPISQPVFAPEFGILWENLDGIEERIEKVITESYRPKLVRELKEGDGVKTFRKYFWDICKRFTGIDEKAVYMKLLNCVWDLIPSNIVKGHLKYLEDISPRSAFVGYEDHASVKDAIGFVHEYGGVAGIAHPNNLYYNKEGIDSLIEEWKDEGLGAIEVYSQRHDTAKIGYYKELAEKHDLVKTGGSDDEKYKVKVGYSALERLKQKLLEIHCY
ncbi:hypothetical protein KY330_03780 [Candidatus Woesearchaeota archaeon]|nr:hypothetical protein [Candidatus Woesearchaeota archaeon]